MNDGQSPLGGQQFGQNNASGQAIFNGSNTLAPQSNAGYSPLPQDPNSQFLTIGNGFDEGKNKKKKIVFFSVIGFVVFVALLVIIIILTKNNAKNSAIESFNKFANYVVSGEDSNQPMSVSIEDNYDYYFVKTQSTQEGQAELFSKTDSLLQQFAKDSQSISNNDSDEASLLNDEIQLLDFMKNVYTKKKITKMDIQQKYLEEGISGVDNWMMGYYNLSDNNADSYSGGFKTSYFKWKNAVLAVYQLYIDNNCVFEGHNSFSCLANNNDAIMTLDTLKKEESEAYTELNYYYNLSNTFVFNVFKMNDELYGAKSNKQEENNE